MKYPFENTTVWDLIRHPFDEESGDPDGRTYMRLLSNIFFPIYVFLQVWVPIQVTMDICLDSGHPVPNVEQVELVGQDTEPSAELSELMEERMKSTEQKEDPIFLTIMVAFSVWLCLLVGFWTLWVILSVFVRYATSTYFHKQLIVIFWSVIYVCTKKTSSKREKRQEKLDAAMVELGIVKVETSGKVLSLEDIANPAMDFDAIDSGVSLYMEDYKGKYSGKNIAALFLFLSEKKLILSDNLALFYRILNSRYPDNSWVSDNAVLKGVNGMAGGEKLSELQKGIAKKYFSQIKID